MNTAETIASNIILLKTCGVCKRVCSEPRTLECLHSFCLECLKSLIAQNSGSDAFCCPTCSFHVLPSSGLSVDHSFLESLNTDAVFSDRNSALVRLGIIGCKKHPGYFCEFFYRDSLELACGLCKRQRPELCDELNEEAATAIRNKHHELVNKSVETTKCEIREILETLKSRENVMLGKNDETVLGILKYFSDLKMQIMEYLTRHEREVLDKLKKITGSEMTNIVTYSKHCLSLLQSLDYKFSFLSRPFSDSEQISALTSYLGLDVFQSHIDEYAAKAKTIKQTVQDETDIRFIINTELEDMLTGGGLIDIEVINSRTRGSSDGDRNMPRSEPEITETSTDNTESVIAATNSTSRNEILITVSPPDTSQNVQADDQPPPPYPEINTESNTYPTPSFSDPNFHSPQGTTGATPSAPSFVELTTTPVVPRGLTHGVYQEPVTPPGTPRDDHMLKIQPMKKFKIGLSGRDRTNPSLAELCWINEYALIALDRRNKSAKIFDDQGRNLSLYNFSLDPYGCTVYKFAGEPYIYMTVAFPKAKKLSVFSLSINDNFRIRFEYDKITNKGYTCIAFSETAVQFVCATTSPFSLPSIDILDRRGNFLKSFNGSDVVRLGYPRSIRVNSQEIIAISDYKTSRVMFMDMEGIHQSVFDGTATRNLTDPQGIGVYEKLNLFVIADTRANRIYCVDSNGTTYDDFGQNSLSENTPRFIDFSRSSNSKLAIGHGNGYISLYKIIDTVSSPDYSTV